MRSVSWSICVGMMMASSGFAQAQLLTKRPDTGATGTMLQPAMALGVSPAFPGSFSQDRVAVDSGPELRMESTIRGNPSDVAVDGLSVTPEPLLNQGGLVRASRVQVRDGAVFLEGRRSDGSGIGSAGPGPESSFGSSSLPNPETRDRVARHRAEP